MVGKFWFESSAGRGALGAPQRQRTPPGTCLRARPGGQRQIGCWNRSGAPNTSRSSPRSSALHRRRDENGTWATTLAARHPPARRGGSRRGEVARWCAGGVTGERPREDVLLRALGRYHLDHPQRRFGQRPRLIGADDVDGSERLDRVELLGERAALGHLERGHCRGDADQQDQPLWHEVHNGCRDRLHPRVVVSRGRTETVSPIASGTASASNHRNSRSFARSSGERGWRKARAVVVSRSARLSRPTASPRTAPSFDRERTRPHRGPGRAPRAQIRRSGWLRPARARPPTPTCRPRPPDRPPTGARRPPRPPGRPGRRRSAPSRTTIASGATSAARRSSARFDGSPEMTRPRRSSRCPGTGLAPRRESIVSTPNSSRIPFGIVTVFARTMLA